MHLVHVHPSLGIKLEEHKVFLLSINLEDEQSLGNQEKSGVYPQKSKGK
uniref:Uncharacterized protein n=1 Tax=Rhizophora mucronata TaxID=61149 RepID=A0A2P2Q6R5_RHIMU